MVQGVARDAARQLLCDLDLDLDLDPDLGLGLGLEAEPASPSAVAQGLDRLAVPWEGRQLGRSGC